MEISWSTKRLVYCRDTKVVITRLFLALIFFTAPTYKSEPKPLNQYNRKSSGPESTQARTSTWRGAYCRWDWARNVLIALYMLNFGRAISSLASRKVILLYGVSLSNVQINPDSVHSEGFVRVIENFSRLTGFKEKKLRSISVTISVSWIVSL